MAGKNLLKRLEDRHVAAQLNRSLAAIQVLLPKLTLNGAQLHIEHVHVGPGIYYRPSRNVPRHKHLEIQIEYLIGGRADFFFEQASPVVLEKGDSILIFPGTTHGWRCDEKTGLLGMTLAVSGPSRARFLESKGESFFQIPGDWEGSQILEAMLSALVCDEEALLVERSTALFLNWLCLFLEKGFLLQEWKVDSAPVLLREDRSQSVVNQAIMFMQQRYMEKISTEDIALHVGLSVRQLNRHFKVQHNSSPSQNLQRIRLNKAMEMLCAFPEYSVKAVAYDCGFQSHSYFTRCFIKAFGIHPSQVQHYDES